MKLEFMKMPEYTGGSHIEDHQVGKLFEVFMNGFVDFVGHCSKDFKISYNNFYHCYTIDLWQICGNRGDSIGHFEKVYNWFVDGGYYVSVDGTSWNHNHHDDLLPTVYGIEMTIYPKEVKDQSYIPWVKDCDMYKIEKERRKKDGFGNWQFIKERFGLHPERFGTKHRVIA